MTARHQVRERWHTPAETRLTPRLRLAPMYTLLRVRRQGEKRFRWTGYIYDISRSGMRFELDEPLEPGTPVEVRAMLPGSQTTRFSASGRVVRLHDDADEPGPIRMGLQFEQFTTKEDRLKLTRYLSQSGRRAA